MDYGHISEGRKERRKNSKKKIKFYVFKPVEFNSQLSPIPNMDNTVHKNVYASIIDLMFGRK